MAKRVGSGWWRGNRGDSRSPSTSSRWSLGWIVVLCAIVGLVGPVTAVPNAPASIVPVLAADLASAPVPNVPVAAKLGTEAIGSSGLRVGPARPESAYVQDQAGILDAAQREQIVRAAGEIEETMRIRVLVRIERVDDLTNFARDVDEFFNRWIREIELEKRGILFYAAMPANGPDGRLNLRVGIGLKYLITREMGERVLRRFSATGDEPAAPGQGFVDGVANLKRLLIDEFKREQVLGGASSRRFSVSRFLWDSKELLLALLIGLLLCWMVFVVERCPRCNASLQVETDVLKPPTAKGHGLQRRMYLCPQCGFARRKKELIYPAGVTGWWMWLFGDRRNVKVVALHADDPLASRDESLVTEAPASRSGSGPMGEISPSLGAGSTAEQASLATGRGDPSQAPKGPPSTV